MPFLGQLKKKALYFSNGTLIFFLNVKEQRLWTCCLCWGIDCYACLHTPVAFLTFVPRQPNHLPCVGDFSWSTLLSFSCNQWSLSPQTSWVTCSETRIQRICLKRALSQVPAFISLNDWNTDLCWVVTFSVVQTSYFLLPSPLWNGHLVKKLTKNWAKLTIPSHSAI